MKTSYYICKIGQLRHFKNYELKGKSLEAENNYICLEISH